MRSIREMARAFAPKLETILVVGDPFDAIAKRKQNRRRVAHQSQNRPQRSALPGLLSDVVYRSSTASGQADSVGHGPFHAAVATRQLSDGLRARQPENQRGPTSENGGCCLATGDASLDRLSSGRHATLLRAVGADDFFVTFLLCRYLGRPLLAPPLERRLVATGDGAMVGAVGTTRKAQGLAWSYCAPQSGAWRTG
jgi:hypothetical protein